MSTEIASAYVALTTAMPGVKKEIEKALGDAEPVVDESGKKSGQAWAKNLSLGLAAGAAVVATAAGVMATKVISAFGELEQNLGGSEAVFGEYAASVQKTGQEAYKNLGVSQSEYLATANKMGALFQGSGVEQVRSLEMTTDAMQRAADMASVMGIDMDVAMESVAGAAKGNFTMMDNLGVAMNATSIEAYAASKGMEDWSFATATSAEKAELAMGMFMDNTSQYAGNYAKEATETVSGSFGLLSAAWEEVIGGLGNKDADMSQLTANLAEAVKAVIANVSPIVANLFETLPETIGSFLAGIAPVVEGFVRDLDIAPLNFFFDVLKNTISFVQDNAGWLTPLATGIAIVVGAVVVWTAAQAVLNAVLTANPIGLVILAIGLLVGAIILLVQNWDTVVAWITDVWGGFIGWITGVIDGFVGWWNGIWAGFAAWIGGIWEGIVSGVTGYLSRLQAVIVMVVTAVQSVWNSVWSNVSNFFIGIWNNIVSTIQTIQGVFSTVFGAVRGIIVGAFEGAVSVVKGVINNIIGLINGVIRGINGLIGSVGGAIGIDIAIPTIPRLAEGGIVSARRGGILANIGEGRYDEAVVPLTPQFKESLMGGNNRPGIEQTFNLPVGVSAFEVMQIARNERNEALRGA